MEVKSRFSGSSLVRAVLAYSSDLSGAIDLQAAPSKQVAPKEAGQQRLQKQREPRLTASERLTWAREMHHTERALLGVVLKVNAGGMIVSLGPQLSGKPPHQLCLHARVEPSVFKVELVQ